MAYKEMTAWIIGPEGTRFCLVAEQNGTISILMRRPTQGVESDVKVISFRQETDKLSNKKNGPMNLVRYHDLPSNLGLKLTGKGQIVLA